VDSEQPSFTDIEYGNRRRVSRREQFLETMNATIPWARWVGLIEPHYYQDKPGKKGRKAKPIETMLRMYLLQVWFSLSDEGVEDAIYDSYAMRRFLGLDFAVEQVADATTLLHFRHLLEEHKLGEKLLAAQNEIFEEQGWIMRGGSIVDATIIAAPSSTKNATGQRDPEMHQTKKGNQWYFGMKAHIGIGQGSMPAPGTFTRSRRPRRTSMTSTRRPTWSAVMTRWSTAMPGIKEPTGGLRSPRTSICRRSSGGSLRARVC
jgi:IS5 family transposase